MKKKNFIKGLAIAWLTTMALMPMANAANDSWTMLVDMQDENISFNQDTYIAVTALDKNNMQMGNLKPFLETTSRSVVDLGQFYQCSSAEWMEICSKFVRQDWSSYQGLSWSYVAKVSSRNIDEDVTINVFSWEWEWTKKESVTLRIWEGGTPEKIEKLSDVPPTWKNDNTLNYFIAFTALFIMGMGYVLAPRKN